MAIRLVLADDHPIVLHGLEELFARHADFEVLCGCRDGREALEAVRRRQPDVLVMDLRMPEIGGLDVLRAIAREKLACRTVLLTAAMRNEEAVEAFELGVMGVVLKESSPDTLLECVRRVHQGVRWVDRETVTGAFGRVLRQQTAAREATSLNLTARELDIIRHVAEGLRNREIADRLSISEGTVKIHLHHIYEKLHVDGRLELVLFAQQKGLV